MDRIRKISSSDEILVYEPTGKETKRIFTYISKDDGHKRGLIEDLKECGYMLACISPELLEVRPAETGYDGKSLQESCEGRILDFISRFSTWNQRLTPSSVDDTMYIDAMIKKYRRDCFSTWYQNTSMILVTGPKQIVDEMKMLILTKLGGQYANDSDNETLRPFEYTDVHRAILRFVSKQLHFLSELKSNFKYLANVQIEDDGGNPKLILSPIKPSGMPDGIYKNRCFQILKSFFNRFDHWKGKFDPVAVKKCREKKPELFQITSHEDHFVQWFCDTGVVRVTGTCDQVQRCKNFINDVMGTTKQQPPPASPVSSPDGVVALAHQISKFLGAIQPPQVPLSVPVPTTGGNQALTAGKSQENPSETPSGFIFQTRNTRHEILKFVQNSPKFRNELANCKEELAKVDLEKDLQVRVTFKQKGFNKPEKRRMIDAIKNFFARFETKILKLDDSKWKKVEQSPALFGLDEGLYITRRQDRDTVKITGLKEKVVERVREFEEIMFKEVDTEEVPVNVFIAHRECGLWQTVEKRCTGEASKILITPMTTGKIQYEGRREIIEKAKRFLGEMSEKLFEKEVDGMSSFQLRFLKKCGQSQNEYFKTGKNIMDGIYENFRRNSVQGSLAFNESEGIISLLSLDQSGCTKAIDFLRENIIRFEIDLSDRKMKVPHTKFDKDLDEKFRDSLVYIYRDIASKKLLVSCLKEDRVKVENQVREAVQAYDVKDVQKFYTMQKEKAKHIEKRQALFKAKAVKALEQGGKYGLLVTCEQDDLETVEMNVEEMLRSIEIETGTISGYGLYEHLAGGSKHLKVEDETKCSIFLKPNGKVLVPSKRSTSVTVKVGDILDEKCDAIANSTGRDMNFSGQLSKAICEKYGSNIWDTLMDKAEWIVTDQVCLCPTKGQLPWKYILNLATPGLRELKRFLLNFLIASDKKGITSLAIPAIGTGGLGMDPTSVAVYMKEAIHEFCADQVSNLRDIRLVLYESSLLHVFKDISLSPSSGRVARLRHELEKKEGFNDTALSPSSGRVVEQNDNLVSSGLIATMCGSSKENVKKAMTTFKEVCKSCSGKKVIKDFPTIELPSLQNEAQDICHKLRVRLEWRNNGQECVIEGFLDKVLDAERKIKDLIEADIPHHWTPMTNGQLFVKIRLNEASDEYLRVKRKFLHSSPRFLRLLKIERIQNPDLYKLFKQRDQITRSKNSKDSVTNQLFHGTRSDKIDMICAAGFDRNFAGENGTVYGRGVYFAVNSSYSVNYAGNGPTKYIFLADVITGDYTKGKGEYKAPPNKGNGVLFDSVVDNPQNPTIYVVFRDSSVYPLYLITFE